jgi:ribosomal protein S18 acetylase RimI-like enzyme
MTEAAASVIHDRLFCFMDYSIRPLTAADEPILWEMLYQALQSSEGHAAPSPDAVRQPEVARYVQDWGREGDSGLLAIDPEHDQVIGAVWCRSETKEPSAGDSEHATQLVFTVRTGYRRRGIGAALLTQWVRANPQQSVVSLRMSATNPAVRLYERFGFKIARDADGWITLRRET